MYIILDLRNFQTFCVAVKYFLFFFCCVCAGFWKSKEELKKLQMTERLFIPQSVSGGGAGGGGGVYKPVLQSWEQALQRSMHWYNHTS